MQAPQLLELPLSPAAFKDVKSLKVFWSNLFVIIFLVYLNPHYFVQAYFAVMGCDFHCDCALDCPVLGGRFST